MTNGIQWHVKDQKNANNGQINMLGFFISKIEIEFNHRI